MHSGRKRLASIGVGIIGIVMIVGMTDFMFMLPKKVVQTPVEQDTQFVEISPSPLPSGNTSSTSASTSVR